VQLNFHLQIFVEVKNAWSSSSTSPIRLHDVAIRNRGLLHLYDRTIPASLLGWFICNLTSLYQLNTSFGVECYHRFRHLLGTRFDMTVRCGEYGPSISSLHARHCLCSLLIRVERSRASVILVDLFNQDMNCRTSAHFVVEFRIADGVWPEP
jgi:hypothetical protein